MLTKDDVRALCRKYFDSVDTENTPIVEMFMALQDLIEDAKQTSNKRIMKDVQTALTDYAEGR